MEEHTYEYKVVFDERDKENIIKGLSKIIEEKAVGIKQLCAGGRIDGRIYDSELEALDIAMMDIESVKNTLSLFKNLEK